MKLFDWFKNFGSSTDNLIFLDLSSDETEYYIDLLDHQICYSMNGSFCVARNLIEITEKALKEGYNKKVNCKEDLRLIYGLAARIYFLAKFSTESNEDDALDIINLINFLNLPFKQQYEALSAYSEIQPWLAEEVNDFYNQSIAVPSAVQKALTELLGILADQHTKSLFSKQGRCSFERDRETGIEIRQWRVMSAYQHSEKNLKVNVGGEKHLSRYVKVLVEKMDEFYKEQGHRLAVYSFNPRHPLSEHRHVDKVVREIVLHCTIPPKYVDITPVHKETNVNHEITSEGLSAENPIIINETKTEILEEEEVLSPEEEEKIATAKLKAMQINEKLEKVVPDGLRYQQMFDSTSFMIALTTPKRASSSLRIYRNLLQKEQDHREYHKSRR